MIDQESKNIISENERLSNFIKGDDWALIKGMLSQKLMDMGSVFGLDNKEPDKVYLEICARQLACNIIKDIISDIEGRGNTINTIKTITREDYIIELKD